VETEWRRSGDGGARVKERRQKGEADLSPLVEGRGDGAGEVARHALFKPLVEHLVLCQLERLRTRAPRERSGGQGLCHSGEGGYLYLWVCACMAERSRGFAPGRRGTVLRAP
jgi:hypothetical protein